MALRGENTQAAQELVLKLLVNTAMAGNQDFMLGGTFYAASQTSFYMQLALKKTGSAKLNVVVNGILNLNEKGTYANTDRSVYTGDLAGLFLGAGATTNIGGVASAVDFIDIGPVPFTDPEYKYTAAEMVTKQYILMQHFYQIFSAFTWMLQGITNL